MISKKHKFPMRTDFLRFRAKAKRIVTPHLTAFYLPHTPSEAAGEVGRLGVIVPVKVSKLATTRNFLKRLTYDTLFPPIKDKNIDCMVVYKPLSLVKSRATKKLIISEINSLKFVI